MRGARFESGALVLHLPLRLRWTLPLLFLCTGCYNVGSALGCFLVVVAHELGHAGIARWRGLYVVEIEVHGAGGTCRHTVGTPLDASFVAWGGVLAQALILGIAWPLTQPWPLSTFVGSFLYGLTVPNVLMILLNLLPMGRLDGVEAWRLFGRFAEGQRRARASAQWQANKDAVMQKAIEDAQRARERKLH